MSQKRAPTFRDLHTNGFTSPRRKPRARSDDAWILDDPDLAPSARSETPLSAWG